MLFTKEVLGTTEMWCLLSLCPTVDVQSSDIISEVLNEVEKRSFTAQDPDDGKDFKLEKVPVNFR